jgi:capsular polysaccharide biosynthesis protein
MNFRDYLSIVRDYWKSILAVTIAGVVAAVGVLWLSGQSASYVARASVFLSVARGSTATEVVGGADYANSQASAFASMAEMQVVLAPVIEKLGLPITPQDLEPSLKTWNDGPIVQIQVSYADEKLSAGIAQAIAEQTVKAVEQLSPVDDAGHPVLVAEVVSPAGAPVIGENRLSTKSALALGLLGGLVVGLTQAALRKVLALSTAGKH